VTSPSARIDLSALVANWRMLGRRAAPAEAAAVVKADAYGLGAGPVTQALAKAGCRRFYVAWPEEGVEVRKAVGAGPGIAVFHGPAADTIRLFAEAQLEPVLNSLDQIGLWIGAGAGPAALHVDTGMSRLGVAEADWRAAATAWPTPTRLVSHLACADEPDGEPKNQSQLDALGRASTFWPNAKRSFSATGGAYLGPRYAMDEIRPGIGLYGGGPIPADGEAPLPVVTLTAPILQLREIGPGETIGYGATFTAKQRHTLATLGIGYADGFLRAASNRGYGVVRGARRPILGRVSMDLIVMDVTGVSAAVGDEVELMGANLPLHDQAQAMGTIDYELLTRLGPRIRRTYVGGA
jgi:alanine racemase